MQPSQYEIQREVEALRDIRRRSVTPGALIIDPDLPNQSPASISPTSGYRSSQQSSATSAEGDSSSSSHEDSSSSDASTPNNPADDPFHLFWVPASMHPEIAPAEFRAFLKEHARTPPSTDGSLPLERSNSVSSITSNLGRKKSMLSRQYRPPENGSVEDETVVPLRRNRSSVYHSAGPQLTISDLQKLEKLAEEASESDDPTQLRNILRRSLSMNMSPSVVDKMGDMPEMGDEVDTPIIVPPPGQILRRAARTKIRKPGLPGDGGGHRFGASRRGPRPPADDTTPTPPPMEPRTSSDMSSSDHGDSVESQPRTRSFSNESMYNRPNSYSEETSIYDAYARDDEDDIITPIVVTSPPPNAVDLPLSSPPPETPQALLDALAPVLHHPQPQRLTTPQVAPDHQAPSRTPSPEISPTPSSASPSRSPPAFLSSPPPPIHQQRKDKDKKGLFGKWGGDKATKKNAKDKEREIRERAEKEKESGFFGSLFGSKKKQDEQPQTLGLSGTSGRDAAHALLGASKSSKSYVPPPSPQLPPGSNPYARYPIHVERAIYRLSHIKLANPRRPLYEQVLISNLMFWYLGVINKTTSPGASPSTNQAASATPNTGQAQSSPSEEKERQEQEQKEREEQRQKLEKEKLEKEEAKRKESPRRGSLTKAPAAGAGRRAEMPVKGPQYEMQHRVMEQEYGGFNGQAPGQGVPVGRSMSAPNVGSDGGPYPRHQQPSGSNQFSSAPPKLIHPQPQLPSELYYNGGDFVPSQQQQRSLPPGAMPPASTEQSPWHSQSPSSRKVSSPSPPPTSPTGPPHRRSRSPPPPFISNQSPSITSRYNANASSDGQRIPGRSLSAIATPSPPLVNGRVRKGSSVHAASPAPPPMKRLNTNGTAGVGEEEDVPLAVWQQQRRK